MAYCPGVELVDGDPLVYGSTAREVLASGREDHGIVTYSRCLTCGTRYVELTRTLLDVRFGELRRTRRAADRAREERGRIRRRQRTGPRQANDHPGRPRRPERTVRRAVVELEDLPDPGQTGTPL